MANMNDLLKFACEAPKTTNVYALPAWQKTIDAIGKQKAALFGQQDSNGVVITVGRQWWEETKDGFVTRIGNTPLAFGGKTYFSAKNKEDLGHIYDLVINIIKDDKKVQEYINAESAKKGEALANGKTATAEARMVIDERFNGAADPAAWEAMKPLLKTTYKTAVLKAYINELKK